MLNWILWATLLIGGFVFWFRVSMDILERVRGDDLLYLRENILVSLLVGWIWIAVLVLGLMPG